VLVVGHWLVPFVVIVMKNKILVFYHPFLDYYIYVVYASCIFLLTGILLLNFWRISQKRLRRRKESSSVILGKIV